MNFGAKSNFYKVSRPYRVRGMNRDLVEDSIGDKKSKGAFEDLYRFSSSDRSGQLVPLCNRLRVKKENLYISVFV